MSDTVVTKEEFRWILLEVFFQVFLYFAVNMSNGRLRSLYFTDEFMKTNFQASFQEFGNTTSGCALSPSRISPVVSNLALISQIICASSVSVLRDQAVAGHGLQLRFAVAAVFRLHHVRRRPVQFREHHLAAGRQREAGRRRGDARIAYLACRSSGTAPPACLSRSP